MSDNKGENSSASGGCISCGCMGIRFRRRYKEPAEAEVNKPLNSSELPDETEQESMQSYNEVAPSQEAPICGMQISENETVKTPHFDVSGMENEKKIGMSKSKCSDILHDADDGSGTANEKTTGNSESDTTHLSLDDDIVDGITRPVCEPRTHFKERSSSDGLIDRANLSEETKFNSW